MIPNSDICYQALLSHDRRFDGVFYVGVTSTGIYCRTICRVKTPAQKNCRFFAKAAQAEGAGFRPCLRCRPELAPGLSPADSMERNASLIAVRIEEGALNHMSVSELAESLKISERHLRRVIESAFGVSPHMLAQTQRLLLAKGLLAVSSLSITEVALASGFSSLRRFNALVKEKYGLSPSQLRSRSGKFPRESDKISCKISYRPPYDWTSILEFLKRRAASSLERVLEGKYWRTVAMGDKRGYLAVSNDEMDNCLIVELSQSLLPVILPVLSRLRRLFDVNASPDIVAEKLNKLAGNNPGLRLPGAFDGFETAVRGILGQQVSVQAASTLMNRICLKYGEKIQTPVEGLERIFPGAQKLASLSVDDLSSLGIVSRRAKCIIEFADRVARGQVLLEPALDPEKSIRQLSEIPGVGDWTAHYIAMRVLSWTDAFPENDLGIQKALKTKDRKKILELAETWRPWRAYAAMHLWKSLEE